MDINKLENINLTDHQKQALIAIHMSPTPHTALGDLQGDEQLKAAADLLADLGAISYEDGGVVVTDTGMQMMKDSALVNDQDQLTGDGMALLQALGGGEADQPPQPESEFSDNQSDQGTDDLNFDMSESWSLIKNVNRLVD